MTRIEGERRREKLYDNYIIIQRKINHLDLQPSESYKN